jgi:hypothetical protein
MLQMEFVGKPNDPLRKRDPADPASSAAGTVGDLNSDDEVEFN